MDNGNERGISGINHLITEKKVSLGWLREIHVRFHTGVDVETLEPEYSEARNLYFYKYNNSVDSDTRRFQIYPPVALIIGSDICLWRNTLLLEAVIWTSCLSSCITISFTLLLRLSSENSKKKKKKFTQIHKNSHILY